MIGLGIKMDWNFVLTIAGAALGLAVGWGAMNTRMKYLEKLVEELRLEVKDFRKLGEDLAVVKHELGSIKEMITRIIKDIE